jgi:hypothetical protein
LVRNAGLLINGRLPGERVAEAREIRNSQPRFVNFAKSSRLRQPRKSVAAVYARSFQFLRSKLLANFAK